MEYKIRDAANIMAFHILWTRPRQNVIPGDIKEQPIFDAFELMTGVISCTLWRQQNGPCKLFTDSIGADWLAKKGIIKIWDEVDTTLLSEIPNEIHAPTFWDIAKVYVLKKLNRPAVALDFDLIVWEPIAAQLSSDLHFLHWEKVCAPWYESPEKLQLSKNYVFDPSWDLNLDAVNTGFLYSGNIEFSMKLWEEASCFASNTTADAGLAEFLFAVQRLVPIVAKKMNMNMHSQLNYYHDPYNNIDWELLMSMGWKGEFPFCINNSITHVWNLKHVLKDAPLEWRTDYLTKIVECFQQKMPHEHHSLDIVKRLYHEALL